MSEKKHEEKQEERPIYETENWIQHKKRMKLTFQLEGLSKLIKKRIDELKAEILEKYNFLKINTFGELQVEDGEGGFYDDNIKSRELIIIHPKMRVVGKVKYENLSSDLSIFRRDSLRKH